MSAAESACSWPARSTDDVELGVDGVHVWCASLDDPPLEPEQLAGLLDVADQDTAARYVFARDRARSLVSRGMLRYLLGAYLDLDPRQIELRFGPQGKPELAARHSAYALRFNVSHADGKALYAVTRRREVGIDVEHVRPMPAALAVARRFFAPSEIAALMRAGNIDQAFFIGWTRKEAYLKAHGGGLSVALDKVEVELRPSDTPIRLHMPSDQIEAQRWLLYDLRPAPGFIGALCLEGAATRVCCWRLSAASD